MKIYLVGYRGAGKSECGKLLAERIHYNFLDTDEEIVRLSGTTINEIFETKGEEYFRMLEANALKNTLNLDRYVISTGGGACVSNENKKVIKTGICIFLNPSINTIYERIKNSTTRPKLTNLELRDEIEYMINKRISHYKACADIEIVSDNYEIHETVNKIIQLLTERNLL